MSLEALTEISRFYGKNPDYVLAGGGNTSWKDKDTLFVKGSGLVLADANPGSFVRMDRKALAWIWEKEYPIADDERESAILIDMMSARKSGEEQKRPSVEALLHDIIPFAYVVHLHPAFVNGITCSQAGKTAIDEIFGNKAIWIPSTTPGYILSKTVKNEMDEYIAANGTAPAIIFLQNHGVFAGAENIDGIKNIYTAIMQKISAKIKRNPDFSGEKTGSGITAAADNAAKTLAELSDGTVIFMQNAEILSLVKDRSSFHPVSSAFSPDHIVYAGSDPLFIETTDEADIKNAWNNHVTKNILNPKTAAVQGLGIFCIGQNEKTARLALLLFKDAVRIAVYSESFGGPLFMTRDKIDFINNWEVERFRSDISAK